MTQLLAARKTDAAIQQDVLRELKWDPRVDETDVGVEVDDGVVTLSGTVANWAGKYHAMEAAHRVRGVLDVANDVVVKVPGRGAPTDIAGVRGVVDVIVVKAPAVEAARVRQAIEGALERQAEREARRVSFEIEDGEVKVYGTVRSWAERKAVIGAARGTPGVRTVDDKLRIDPF